MWGCMLIESFAAVILISIYIEGREAKLAAGSNNDG